LSIVPNNQLKSADSLELVTFPIEEVMSASPYRMDFWTRYRGYWKDLVIRNLQPIFNCTYRTDPQGILKPLPPNSERPVKGWGSYFEVVTADPAPNIEIDYNGVTQSHAVLQNG